MSFFPMQLPFCLSLPEKKIPSPTTKRVNWLYNMLHPHVQKQASVKLKADVRLITGTSSSDIHASPRWVNYAASFSPFSPLFRAQRSVPDERVPSLAFISLTFFERIFLYMFHFFWCIELMYYRNNV